MAIIKTQFKDFEFFIDGLGWAGHVLSCKPPVLQEKAESFIAGGMAAEIEIPTGHLEKMEFEAKLSGCIPEIHRHMGEENVLCSILGSLEQGEVVVPVAHIFRAYISKVENSELKRGELGEMTITGSCRTYELLIAGVQCISVDAENNIYKVGGEDRLALRRAALGQF